jgi:hypothetical protein
VNTSLDFIFMAESFDATGEYHDPFYARSSLNFPGKPASRI